MKEAKFGTLGKLVRIFKPNKMTIFKFVERAIEGQKMPKIVKFHDTVFERYETGDPDQMYYVSRDDDSTLISHILNETEIESVKFLKEKITIILW